MSVGESTTIFTYFLGNFEQRIELASYHLPSVLIVFRCGDFFFFFYIPPSFLATFSCCRRQISTETASRRRRVRHPPSPRTHAFVLAQLPSFSPSILGWYCVPSSPPIPLLHPTALACRQSSPEDSAIRTSTLASFPINGLSPILMRFFDHYHSFHFCNNSWYVSRRI